jgi:hypothetical protein
MSKSDHPSRDTELFTDIRRIFHGRDFEIYLNTGGNQPGHFAIQTKPTSRYVFFSNGGNCTVTVRRIAASAPPALENRNVACFLARFAYRYFPKTRGGLLWKVLGVGQKSTAPLHRNLALKGAFKPVIFTRID